VARATGSEYKTTHSESYNSGFLSDKVYSVP